MTDTPKIWGAMTDAEKGEILLAKYEGRVLEVYRLNCGKVKWVEMEDTQTFYDHLSYRIRTQPKRETVVLRGAFYGSGLGLESNGWNFSNDWMIEGGSNHRPAYRITFDLIDGKPDRASIRMEEIDND